MQKISDVILFVHGEGPPQDGWQFYEFLKELAKALINKSYMNDNKCGIPENTTKRKISHVWENAPTVAIE